MLGFVCVVVLEIVVIVFFMFGFKLLDLNVDGVRVIVVYFFNLVYLLLFVELVGDSV